MTALPTVPVPANLALVLTFIVPPPGIVPVTERTPPLTSVGPV